MRFSAKSDDDDDDVDDNDDDGDNDDDMYIWLVAADCAAGVQWAGPPRSDIVNVQLRWIAWLDLFWFIFVFIPEGEMPIYMPFLPPCL